MSEYWNAMVPEITVSNLDRSLAFYLCLGFSVRYRRENPPFAYLEIGQAQLMLEQIHESGWLTGSLEPPFGRGVNFQIEVESVRNIEAKARIANIALYEGCKESWYFVGEGREEGQLEVLLQDPDGFLLRFIEPLGSRENDA
ncbi:VOC family protein [Ningiella sp. W23]|uniref:VOC family protein n=1 Tax=Ningiella sp. W23 TaxID=3023715 RepID=UPI003757D1F5